MLNDCPVCDYWADTGNVICRTHHPERRGGVVGESKPADWMQGYAAGRKAGQELVIAVYRKMYAEIVEKLFSVQKG